MSTLSGIFKLLKHTANNFHCECAYGLTDLAKRRDAPEARCGFKKLCLFLCIFCSNIHFLKNAQGMGGFCLIFSQLSGLPYSHRTPIVYTFRSKPIFGRGLLPSLVAILPSFAAGASLLLTVVREKNDNSKGKWVIRGWMAPRRNTQKRLWPRVCSGCIPTAAVIKVESHRWIVSKDKSQDIILSNKIYS